MGFRICAVQATPHGKKINEGGAKSCSWRSGKRDFVCHGLLSYRQPGVNKGEPKIPQSSDNTGFTSEN